MVIIHDVKISMTCSCGTVFSKSFQSAEKDIKAVCPLCKEEHPLAVIIEYKGLMR